MPETSPNLGLQAPLGTEPVSQGDDLMRANNAILDAWSVAVDGRHGTAVKAASGTTPSPTGGTWYGVPMPTGVLAPTTDDLAFTANGIQVTRAAVVALEWAMQFNFSGDSLGLRGSFVVAASAGTEFRPAGWWQINAPADNRLLTGIIQNGAGSAPTGSVSGAFWPSTASVVALTSAFLRATVLD